MSVLPLLLRPLAHLGETGAFFSAAGLGIATGFAFVRSVCVRESLEDKVVVITGGTRGLGLELARLALSCRARVAICGRDPASLERARAELIRRGEVIAVPCDVTDRGEVEELVYAVETRLGPIDVLINNAGIIQVGPVSAMTLDDYEQAMATHFWGPLHLIRRVLPTMERRGGGRIVNIASIGGRVSVPHLVPYSASKHALVGLSRGLRAELKGKNVSVTTVMPGLIRTGSPRNATFVGDAARERGWFQLSDSLPLLSMRTEAAARKILRAAMRGKAELFVGAKARFAAAVAEAFPNLTEGVLALVQRRLPADPGVAGQHLRGADTRATPLTRIGAWLSTRAELRQNQLLGAR